MQEPYLKQLVGRPRETEDDQGNPGNQVANLKSNH
jgi:hypothetical protein